ncbi:hypothetical protein [Pectinatus brassicae]|uniref:Uncharacterized protein n=1 Tax=Pectinatus brassicae TaxID=862415 RepID=A0A840UD57_9FIRM|nr:hypothetical protein [Pectinatus brassicae]MBB5335016.1 hypothetical protein [Pectinatus brassicae]
MRIRLLLIIFSLLTFAAFTMGMTAVPTDTVFSCKGLKLGDDYQAMVKSFGTPWYNDDRLVYGRAVTYYIYHDKTQIGIAKKTGKIVDIRLVDKDYSINKNIRWGATPYKMQSVFGKAEREFVDGNSYFIYSLKTDAKKRLLLQLDSMEDYLIGIRFTSLPLTDDEADEAMYNDSDELDDNIINHNEIDTSAVKNNKKSASPLQINFKTQKSW